MRRQRIRNALIVLLVTGSLTGLWWDTVIDLAARQRAYDRIQPGMTIPEVERLMRGPGEVQFNKYSGPPEYHAERERIYGSPHLFIWEDPYTTVLVKFLAPPPNPPVVTGISRTPKNPPELETLLFWRVVLACGWLLGLALLVRGLLTPKPVDALNSPPNSDTKDGADSPTD